jgi:ferredoxin-NADP reductase
MKYLIDKNEKRDITLVYSAKNESDFVYREIFDEAKAKLGAKVFYVPRDTNGNVDSDFVKKEIVNYDEKIFYISGPEAMVNYFKESLKALNIPRHNIRTDYFPGF